MGMYINRRMIPDLKEFKTLSTQESTGYRGSAKIQRQEGDDWVALIRKPLTIRGI